MKCKNCGDEFKEIKSTQKYCGKEECKRARDLESHRKYKKQTERVANCIVCDKKFTTYYKSLNVCSKECRLKKRASIERKYQHTEGAKVLRRQWDKLPEQRKRQVDYVRQHRQQNIEMSRERCFRYYTSEKGKEVLRQYHKDHYVYLKDTFTQENESCWKTEKIIDDKFHEWNIKHIYQVPFSITEERRYVADWVLEINNEQIIVEYFGLSTRPDEIGDKYRERMQKKIDFYKNLSDYKFIDIYPSTLKERLREIEVLTKLKL